MAFLFNHNLTKVNPNDTVEETFFGKQPNLCILKIFGCATYVHVLKENWIFFMPIQFVVFLQAMICIVKLIDVLNLSQKNDYLQGCEVWRIRTKLTIVIALSYWIKKKIVVQFKITSSDKNIHVQLDNIFKASSNSPIK